jgi:hypothetical protein
VSAPLQSHLRNIFCLHNFSFYKNPLSVFPILHPAFFCIPIQRTCPCQFSYIFLHTKRTPAKILPVSLLHFFKITHPYSNRSYRNFFRSHIFSIHYRNNGNRLTWSNFLTLVPSGFASLLFSRFAFNFPK